MAKSMKLKPSKVMAGAIEKEARKAGLFGEISCIEKYDFTPENYSIYVGNCMYNYDDYDYTKGTFSAIVITYKPECYAMEKYLTSHDLRKICERNGYTYDGLMAGILEEIEI